MEKKEFIINYWSQIALIITILTTGIGYFIRLFLDWRIRKDEIKYTQIHLNKINDLKDFLRSFIATRNSIKKLISQFNFGEHDITLFNEIRSEIINNLNDLEFKTMMLRFLFSSKEIELIETLNRTLNGIYVDVNRLLIWHRSGTPNIEKMNELYVRFEEIQEVDLKSLIPGLLIELSGQIKKDYQIR